MNTEIVEPKSTLSYDASIAVTLATKAKGHMLSATDIVIDSPELLEMAAEDLRNIKALAKEVEEKRTSITGPLNKAVKAVNDLFRAPAEYLEAAEGSLKKAILTYTTEQERIAAEARRLAEQQARVERERLAAEAAKKEAELEAAMATGDDTAIEQAQAEAFAAVVVSQAVTVTPIASAPAKVTGISSRTNHVAEVTDLMALVKAVADGKAPIQCLVADTKFLNAQAKAFKRDGELYPGVIGKAERSLSARAA
jgi:hypothetical protein